MVGETLKNRALIILPLIAALLDQCLDKLSKDVAAAQPLAVEVVVHLGHIARLPQVHQLVHLVDQRRRATGGAVLAQRPMATR